MDKHVRNAKRLPIQVAVDEVADIRHLRQKVVRHAVLAGDEEMIALVDDVLVPFRSPLSIPVIQNRYHGGDVVLPKNITSMRTYAVAEIKAFFDLGKGRVSVHF